MTSEDAVAKARQRYYDSRNKLKQLYREYERMEAEAKVREAEGRALTVPNLCQGRLTTLTATPITTADRNNIRRVFFTPYMGNEISLYYEGRWRLTQFTEMSLDFNNLASTANSNYDVFLSRTSAGALAVEIGTAWTDGSNRATGHEITMMDGVAVYSGDVTKRYLGTVRTDETTGNERIDDSARFRMVWSYCNRVLRPLRMTDTTNTWAYNGTAWRQAGADASNAVVLVTGLVEDPLYAIVKGNVVSTDATRRSASLGIGINTTTVNSAQLLGGAASGSGATMAQLWGRFVGFIPLGQNMINWLESCTGCADATNATFAGDDGSAAKTRSGILAWAWM